MKSIRQVALNLLVIFAVEALVREAVRFVAGRRSRRAA